MGEGEIVTRQAARTRLRRALVVNALAKPVNLVVPAAVVVAAVATGAGWLVAVAAVT